MSLSFCKRGILYAVPIIHYNMEMAAQVKSAFDTLKPDCVAVELPETMQAENAACCFPPPRYQHCPHL